MSRPPRAKESVLDAYESLLVAEGGRGATMEAVAAEAGVSKGGLLYHYASKDALEGALLDRLHHLVELDIEEMLADPDGIIAAFVRSSQMTDTPLDRAIVATSRLAQGGHTSASAALRLVRERWEDVLRPHTRDETALQLVLLVSDGLYFNNALATGAVPGPLPQGDELDALVALVERSVR
ncbi:MULTISPECIES: TetR/AcrR family transcriptional regulator [unclassified Microbacterium]|uniref:TetR/AcrR family transcriptional regulator n=1 Tax=unclassified Microbacterium TaxID=2609290 RepID=UPI0038646DE8